MVVHRNPRVWQQIRPTLNDYYKRESMQLTVDAGLGKAPFTCEHLQLSHPAEAVFRPWGSMVDSETEYQMRTSLVQYWRRDVMQVQSLECSGLRGVKISMIGYDGPLKAMVPKGFCGKVYLEKSRKCSQRLSTAYLFGSGQGAASSIAVLFPLWSGYLASLETDFKCKVGLPKESKENLTFCVTTLFFVNPVFLTGMRSCMAWYKPC